MLQLKQNVSSSKQKQLAELPKTYARDQLFYK